MSSWLDRTQKAAHAHEMEPDNTSPFVFVVLAIVQAVVTQLLGRGISFRFLSAASTCIGSHWIGFILARLMGTDKLFDITEDVSYFFIIMGVYRSIDQPSARQSIVFVAGLFWCVRICAFVGYRIMVRGHDWRFDKLSTGKAYSFFAWTCGGTWCWLNGFALWQLADMPGPSSSALGLVDFCGLVLAVVGFVIEGVADVQKYRFNMDYAYDRNKDWIASGVWAWSRHPNYCGEIIIWTGLTITCFGSFQQFNLRGLLLTAVTPLWSFFFLVFTSLMLLEKRADAKWGGNARYQEYKRNVPVLFPGL